MQLTFALLLLHSADVPLEARTELRAAFEAPVEERGPHLRAAARILNAQIGLDCADARELVGLHDDGSC